MGKRIYEDDEYHWYALDVVRQKEYVAGYLLNKMGCVTFIPTETKYRKKSRYTKGKLEVAYAAFPGVVFAGFPTYPNWLRVRSLGLVNGVLSLPDSEGRVYPRRIDTASREWMMYRGMQTDGQLTIERHLVRFRGQEVERSVPLIHVQGKGVIRSPAMLKNKASSNRPLVVKATGERARKLQGLLDWSKDVGLPHVEAA
jgi:hypothetical protein